MPQISVYLSPELLERVQRARQAGLMNVSAVCQRAFEMHLRRLELKSNEAARVNQTLDQASVDLNLLAQRIQAVKTQRYELGFDGALQWALSAGYRELEEQRDEYVYNDFNERSRTPLPEEGRAIVGKRRPPISG